MLPNFFVTCSSRIIRRDIPTWGWQGGNAYVGNSQYSFDNRAGACCGCDHRVGWFAGLWLDHGDKGVVTVCGRAAQPDDSE
jgi:hypothetical protein